MQLLFPNTGLSTTCTSKMIISKDFSVTKFPNRHNEMNLVINVNSIIFEI